MPKRKSDWLPKYQLHKASGQGLVEFPGERPQYLGPFGSDSSHEQYNRLVAEWIDRGRRPRPDPAMGPVVLSVVALANRYREEHVKRYYVKENQPTSEQAGIASAMRPLLRLYAGLPAVAFGVFEYQAVRAELIRLRWARTTINGAMSRIARMFRWAARNLLVPAAVPAALREVGGLAKGREFYHGAKEPPPVRPVRQADIDAIEPFVSRQVWAMVSLQLLTGMRPGELVIMRRRDIDTAGGVWIYKPESHKCEHHGLERAIAIGPQGQKLIKEGGFLKPELDAYLFSPADATRERMEAQRAARIQKYKSEHPGGGDGIQPSQVDRSKLEPKRKPGDHYTTAAYRKAITYACDRADQAAKKQLREEGMPVPEGRVVKRWHPHQLRHNAASLVRREMDLDAARAVLGHSSTKMTETYAELDLIKASDVMAKIG